MSYTPTTWATGDVITAEKMNKIEGCLQNAGEVLIVTASNINTNYTFPSGTTLDKTWQEIADAFDEDKTIILKAGSINGSSSNGAVRYLVRVFYYLDYTVDFIGYSNGNVNYVTFKSSTTTGTLTCS